MSKLANQWAEAQARERALSDQGPNPDCQCQADGCKRPLNPEFVFCTPCLKLVSVDLRRRIQKAAFNTRKPSEELLALVRDAREAIRAAEKGAKK